MGLVAALRSRDVPAAVGDLRGDGHNRLDARAAGGHDIAGDGGRRPRVRDVKDRDRVLDDETGEVLLEVNLRVAGQRIPDILVFMLP